ncbi:MAG: DNA polymerase III subunit gamma/tau [Betaproteobacteria bacterium]
MSYVVLARKYRPRTFDQMVGQEAVVRALSSALSTGRLHHAYLFTGTRGIGKTTVSRILAKSLNCTGEDGRGGVTAQPCGRCSACREIDADRYVDYVELDAASNRTIDEVRDLLERAAYKPTVGRYKVFMIDEAHQLTKDAFNALLKTLEEPPDYLKFVLATTDPDKMLPTVLSRCLQFNLRPMAPETVQEHLAQVLQAEGVPYEEAALAVLGRAARGSMRDALSLTDQALAYGQGRLEAAGVRAMIGLVDDDHAVGCLQALAARDAAAVMQSLLSLRDSGQSAVAAVDAMTRALQSMALEQMLPGSLVNPEDEPWRQLASRWDSQEVQLLYAMLLAARAELGLAPDEHAALLMVAWRYFAFVKGPGEAASARPAPQALVGGTQRPARTEVRPAVPVPPVRSVVEPVPQSPVSSELRQGATPAAVAVPPEAAHGASDGATMERWCAWIAALVQAQSVNALVRELGLQAQCVAMDEAAQRLHLKVRSESLASEALATKLAEALNRHTGQAWVLQVSLGEVGDSLALRETRRRDRRQAQAEAMIRQDPLVQDLLAQFPGAQLVPGSVRPVEPTT